MEDVSEKEQIEQMRAWWSEYGNYVIGGIVVGIAIIVGLSQYRSHLVTTQTDASTLYETVFEAVADGKQEEAEAAADQIYADFGSTVYPSQARLAMARLYMDKGRDQDAADSLRAVVDIDGASEYGQVARLRLAKVLLYQGKPDDVTELLANVADNAFTARFSEALGDAYVMQEAYDDARDAYLRAMADATTNPTVDRVLVQMKINDLPEIVAAVSDEAEGEAEPAADEAAVAEDATADGEEEAE